jgi:DNA polymerase IV
VSRRQLQREGVRPNLGDDDTGCTVLHADMDAFFASVELRRRPELAGHPMAVGGRSGRAVVLAATYPARAYGVHSAMPMGRARRLCPDLVVVEPDHAAYREASHAVMEIFRSITPVVEPLSLDEAFLDVSGARRLLGSPARIATLLRSRVADEQALPCSVGVASTKFIAKLASSQAKPDGMVVVPQRSVLKFLHPLPIGAMWGVGERTEEVLARLGMRTIADIAATAESTLVNALGPAAGAHLHALASGHDPRRVVPDEPDRSIGAEETFDRDIDDDAVLRRELLRLSERCAARLRASGQVARTVSVKARYADFSTVTRSRTVGQPTDVAKVIYTTAVALLEALGRTGPLRLVGVRAEGLSRATDTPHQLTIAGDDEEWRAAEEVVDRAAARFGSGALRPAALVEPAAKAAPDGPK